MSSIVETVVPVVDNSAIKTKKTKKIAETQQPMRIDTDYDQQRLIASAIDSVKIVAQAAKDAAEAAKEAAKITKELTKLLNIDIDNNDKELESQKAKERELAKAEKAKEREAAKAEKEDIKAEIAKEKEAAKAKREAAKTEKNADKEANNDIINELLSKLGSHDDEDEIADEEDEIASLPESDVECDDDDE